MQTPCHTSLLSNLACRSLSFLLLGSDSRHTCRFATRAFTNPSVLVAKPDTLVSSRLTHSAAMSRKAPSSTTTDTSLPYANTVGGSTDTLDSGVNTWTRSLCHLHAARRDSDHLAPVGRRHDSFIERRTQCRWEHRSWNRRFGKQEVLDRFVRVQGNNVENCWADQGNTTGEAQRERIGVESKMEYAHFLNDDRK